MARQARQAQAFDSSDLRQDGPWQVPGSEAYRSVSAEYGRMLPAIPETLTERLVHDVSRAAGVGALVVGFAALAVALLSI